MLLRRVGLALAFLTCTGAVAGCAQIVELEPAAEAESAACTDVLSAVPAALAADSDQPLPRRETSSAGTAAWGEPAAVTLRCGMPPPAPSTERCIALDDIDWLLLDDADETWTFVSYGRDPATEVLVDTSRVSALDAVGALSDSVALTERTGSCE